MTAEPTSDFTVCTTWDFREGSWYLLDLLRRRRDYPDIKREVLRLKLRWQPAIILIEYAGTGIPLAQELYNEGLVRLSPVRPESDKVTRAIAQQARLESGRFLIPAEAEWREDFLHAKRSRKPCRSPAVSGGTVCRMHGAGGGAPKGNRNAWKHGRYSAQVIAERRWMRELLRESLDLMAKV
jgi:predicted phage terminase large subunit-like protein